MTSMTERDLAVETFHVFVKSADLRSPGAETPVRMDPTDCPACGVGRLHSRGLTAAGSRRWVCVGCGAWTYTRPRTPEFEVAIFDRLEEAA